MASPPSANTLQALVEARGELLCVRAPAVGVWRDPPLEGTRLSGGTSLGWLVILGRRRALLLPADAEGLVVRAASTGRRLAVEYGQTLLELDASGGGTSTRRRQAAGGSSATSADLPDGARAIVAPTDGVFYSRPGPDQPPFTGPGARIRRGQPVGLVEVMKTFNQILYDGASVPPVAQVLEVRVADGEEVSSGQVLLVVRAAG